MQSDTNLKGEINGAKEPDDIESSIENGNIRILKIERRILAHCSEVKTNRDSLLS